MHPLKILEYTRRSAKGEAHTVQRCTRGVAKSTITKFAQFDATLVAILLTTSKYILLDNLSTLNSLFRDTSLEGGRRSWTAEKLMASESIASK